LYSPQGIGLPKGADDPQADQVAFFESQILFWLIGATDGHAKNFNIFLNPGGRYHLTPFYNVLSAQPAANRGQIALGKFRLAMSAGTNRHYRLSEVMGSHFVQTGKAAGLDVSVMRGAITELLERAADGAAQARATMPEGFADSVHESIAAAIANRLPHLANALDDL
jgi:serine/threonine-protein kinase HipA